jgi:hypothetical protein
MDESFNLKTFVYHRHRTRNMQEVKNKRQRGATEIVFPNDLNFQTAPATACLFKTQIRPEVLGSKDQSAAAFLGGSNITAKHFCKREDGRPRPRPGAQRL